MSHNRVVAGSGDQIPWPAYCCGAADPRFNGPEPPDQVEVAQDLVADLRAQIERAELAVFRRDWQTYRIAILNAHDLSRSLFQ